MSPRVGLSSSAVVEAALAIADERGLDAVTLAAVAARTGVATPSLYKHVGSLAELRSLMGVEVMRALTEHLTAAILGLSGDAAVSALMRSFRGYAREHPSRYAAIPLDTLQNPLTRDVGDKLMQVFLAVLRGYGLRDSAAIHAVRSARTIVHGFVSLEAAGGFRLPEDLDDTFQQLIDMYITSLPRKGESR